MKKIVLFAFYLSFCCAVVLRSLTSSGSEVYRRVFRKECRHDWLAASSVTKKRAGIYARCSRCGATR